MTSRPKTMHTSAHDFAGCLLFPLGLAALLAVLLFSSGCDIETRLFSDGDSGKSTVAAPSPDQPGFRRIQIDGQCYVLEEATGETWPCNEINDPEIPTEESE